MSDDHYIKRKDVECGEGEEKLERLKGRFNRVLARFESPVDLRAHVIDTLAKLRVDELKKMNVNDD